MTNQTVWVCIATYAPEDDVPALCAVAYTAQEAAEQIDNVIHEHCKETGVDEDEWVAQDPIERPILPVDTTPRGIEAWKAAGISEADIEQWFEDKIGEIQECAKDLAHDDAAGMTAADFLEEMALDDDMDDGDDDVGAILAKREATPADELFKGVPGYTPKKRSPATNWSRLIVAKDQILTGLTKKDALYHAGFPGEWYDTGLGGKVVYERRQGKKVHMIVWQGRDPRTPVKKQNGKAKS